MNAEPRELGAATTFMFKRPEGSETTNPLDDPVEVAVLLESAAAWLRNDGYGVSTILGIDLLLDPDMIPQLVLTVE